MEELLACSGGIVTKAALSKYELGKDRPSPVVANKLAAALGVKTMELFSPPSLHVQFTGYRRTTRMNKTQCAQTEAAVEVAVERRLYLAQLMGQEKLPFEPHSQAVNSGQDAEHAACSLRKLWKLGEDPIASVVACLEENNVHVVEHSGPPGFTGLSGVATDTAGRIRAVVVVCDRNMCGERQNLTSVHEIGHVYTKVSDDVEAKTAESWMHRFAGAFMAPAALMRRAFGDKRTDLNLGEMLVRKQELGLSVQAQLFRLADLGVISESLKKHLQIRLSAMGWKQREPNESKPCHPQWLRLAVFRLLSEGVISHTEAERTLGEKLDREPLSLRERKEFLRLPIEQRRKLMSEAAEKSAQWYYGAIERGDLEVADSE